MAWCDVIVSLAADKQRETAKAQADITKVLQEKEQLSQDLNATERSFSGLFKRLDKYKEVIEGSIKVGMKKDVMPYALGPVFCTIM